MCNIDRASEARLLALGLNLIGQVMEASLRENKPVPSTDVLTTATTAYTQGKITKAQYFAVIDALDESTTVETTARTVSTGDQWNQEYLAANKFLNQYRR